jgi:hypothetical protein
MDLSLSSSRSSLGRSLLVALVAASCDGAPPDPPDRDGAPGPDVSVPVEALRWTSSPGWAFGDLTAAPAGDTAVVLYRELTPETDRRWRLQLQHVDALGGRRGPALELDHAAGPSPYGGLALATEGDRVLACWTREEATIVCARVGADGAPLGPAFRAEGHSPALARAGGTWLLAYGVTNQQVVLQPHGDDGSAAGAAQVLPRETAPGDGRATTPVLGVAGAEFLLLSGDSVRLRRFDAQLRPLGEPRGLEVTFWSYASVAATPAGTVVSVAKPYGATVFLIDGRRGVRQLPLDGGGKRGLDVTLVSDGAAIAATWSDLGRVSYGAIAPDGEAAFVARPVPAESRNEHTALVLMKDHSLVLSALDAAGELAVSRLPRR